MLLIICIQLCGEGDGGASHDEGDDDPSYDERERDRDMAQALLLPQGLRK